MNREKLRQELRTLIFRVFVMKHSLSDSEVIGLLREIPELGQAQEVAMTKEETRRELRKVADEFLKAVKERVNMHILLGDVDGLSELVQVVKMVGHYQIVDTIHKKGFSKEFSGFLDLVGSIGAIRKKGFEKEFLEFCDKVGRGK